MSFVWNGVSSDTMKFNVTSRQVYNAPAYDLNAIEVPGRSGDLLNPQNRFKNKQISYTGFLKASDGWLCSDAGAYHELTDDYDPGFTRYGYISGETAISDIEDRPFGVTLTVTFNCKPFMYKAGEPMELPEVKTVGPAAIASFSDGAQDAPLKSLTFNIEPVQDLHGYDSPWPAGGGKNKLIITASDIKALNNLTWTNNSAVNNGITFTILEDDAGNVTGIRANGTASATAQITISKTNISQGIYFLSAEYYSSSAFIRGVFRDANNAAISIGGSVFTDLTAGEAYREVPSNVSYINIYININSGTTVNNVVFKPMLRVRTESSAYAASSNICPISGRTQVDGKHSGADMTDYTPITVPLGRTVYGGTLDVVRGKLNVKPYYASYSGQTLVGPWISSHDKYVAGETPTTGAQVVDMGAAGTNYDVTPKTIKTLLGVNNIWADSGDTTLEYPIPTESPYPFESRPLYEITMAGTGTLIVNGKEWTITNYTGTLYCDTEAMEWYDASQLRNNIVSGDGWPVFEAGENSVSYTGDITKVMVTPRWRTL